MGVQDEKVNVNEIIEDLLSDLPTNSETVIDLPSKPIRAVVDIKKYGIPGRFFPVDDFRYILLLDKDPAITQGVSRQVP